MTSYGASLYPSIRAVLNSDEGPAAEHCPPERPGKGQGQAGCLQLDLLRAAAQHPQGLYGPLPPDRSRGLSGTYDDVKEWLRTGQVDIAFLSNNCREEFVLTELFHEPLLCITPMDWPEPPNGVMTPA